MLLIVTFYCKYLMPHAVNTVFLKKIFFKTHSGLFTMRVAPIDHHW